ncbi:hypothetical protein D3C77_442850 [compost metagenome]
MSQPSKHVHGVFGQNHVGVANHQQRRRGDAANLLVRDVLEVAHALDGFVMHQTQVLRMRRNLEVFVLQLLGHVFQGGSGHRLPQPGVGAVALEQC